ISNNSSSQSSPFIDFIADPQAMAVVNFTSDFQAMSFGPGDASHPVNFTENPQISSMSFFEMGNVSPQALSMPPLELGDALLNSTTDPQAYISHLINPATNSQVTPSLELRNVSPIYPTMVFQTMLEEMDQSFLVNSNANRMPNSEEMTNQIDWWWNNHSET
ncbi:2080_t:CDS:1, partial [Scutellospora calospora]